MSEAPDVTKMSDQQLLAYIHTNQPGANTAAPDAPVASAPVAAPVVQQPLPPLPGYAPSGEPLRRVEPTGGAWKAIQNGGNSLAEGVPVLGAFADEADAATDAALAPALEPILRHLPGYNQKNQIGDLPSFGQRYDAARNLQRFNADQFHDEHPALDTGLKVAGGVGGTLVMLPALGAATAAAGPEAGLLARALTGAAEGGVIGGVDSYGRGQGGVADPSRIRGAEGGAAIGAAGGMALPVVSQVGKVAYRASVGKLVDALRGAKTIQAPMDEEATRLASVLRGDAGPSATTDEQLAGSSSPQPSAQPQGTSPQPDRLNLEAALIAAQRAPLKVNASNVDDAYIRIARAAKRQEMTPQQMADSAQAVGPLGVLADSGESARDLLRAAMNRPGPGATIAEENLTPRQNGVFDAESGTWLARPSSMRVTDQAKAGLGLDGKDFHTEDASLLAGRKAAAGPAYAQMESHPPIDTAVLGDFTASPLFAKAYDRARSISQREFVTLPDGSQKIVPLPDQPPPQLPWRALNLIKQGLDDEISTGRTQGIGATENGANKQFAQRFVAKLDTLNPDFKPARDAFAGPSAMQDALQEGRGLLNEDAPAVAADIASRPESERQMLRLGAYQALQSKLGNANVTFDAANQAGLMKPNQLARFQALFPSQQAFADFYKTMQNEKSMFATNKAAFGNSSTAKQLLNVEEPSDPRLEGAGRVAESLPEGNIMGLIRGIHQLGQESPMSEDTASTIASILSRHHGADMPMVVKKMSEAERAAAIADVIRKSNGTMAGEAASRTTQRGQ